MEQQRNISDYEKEYREFSDAILFDIQKTNWNPSHSDLESFCKETYSEIVEKHKELEQTQEYVMTSEILNVEGCQSNGGVAFTVGSGFTRSESSSTHAIHWALKKLLDEQKINPEPFDFKLLIVGYK